MKVNLILGLGQSMRGDDGAGLAAVERWRRNYPVSAADSRLRVELAELPGLGLLDMLSGATHAILVDAVRSGTTPGTLHLVSADQLASFISGAASAHGWGVAESLALAGKIGSPLPEQLVILGIEAESFGVGAPLSRAVAAALDEAAQMIEQQIQIWDL